MRSTVRSGQRYGQHLAGEQKMAFEQPDYELLKERIRAKYASGQLLPLYQLNGKSYTPEQILQEVEQMTPAGITFMNHENAFLREVARRGK